MQQIFSTFHIIILFTAVYDSLSQEQIDKEHLTMYPYCGRLFGYNEKHAKSRVVNSQDSLEHGLYPWVVFVLRTRKNKRNVDERKICSGTVIAYKHVVTAGHCICSTPHDPNVHTDALCKSSSQNQIVPDKNLIKVFGGSKDRILLQGPLNGKNHFGIDTAYILDDPGFENFVGTTDIGILISNRPLFDVKTLESTNGAMEKPSILPICLGSKNYDFDGQNIHGVGWGETYDESPKPNPTRDPYYSSCMTNEVGKERWRFQACDMKHLQSSETAKLKKLPWSCEKDKLPPDISQERLTRCGRYFVEARRMVRQTDKSNLELMDKVRKIIVYETGQFSKKEHNLRVPQAYSAQHPKLLVCYDQKEFTQKGWCEVHGKSTAYRAWGFCSPSCEKLKDGMSDSKPEIYQDIKWVPYNQANNPCIKSNHWNPDYTICMKKKLPENNVATFETENLKKSIWSMQANKLKFIEFIKEDESNLPPDFQTSYHAPCKGDSGSGQWITIDEDKTSPWKNTKMSQRVLVAVYNTNVLGTYLKSYLGLGKREQGVCGGSITLANGDRLVAENICTKTTNERILDFLKSNSEI